MTILILIGLVVSGGIITYPLGFYLGRRSAWLEFDHNYEVLDEPQIIKRAKSRAIRRDILNAPTLE